jgi:hypothetical protein
MAVVHRFTGIESFFAWENVHSRKYEDGRPGELLEK